MADFEPGKFDDESREYLAGNDVVGITTADTTEGSFGQPIALAHWGAAFDGRFYADGQVCIPGLFADGALTLNQQGFRFHNLEPMAAGGLSAAEITAIAADTVRMRIPNGVIISDDSVRVDTKWKWYLESNFDIQIDFANWHFDPGIVPALEFWFVFEVRGRDGTQPTTASVSRMKTDAIGSTYYRWTTAGGAVSNTQDAGPADAAGKLRITRVGTTLAFYYYNAGWVQIGGDVSAVGNVEDDGVFINCYIKGDSGDDYANVEISDLVLNVADWTNYVGWSKEAASGNRGSQSSMPNHILIVPNDLGVSIIDTDTDRLWLSSVLDTDRAFPVADTSRPLRTTYSNGRILIAQGCLPPDVENYGGILFDFVLDEITSHYPTSGQTFNENYHVSTGAIAERDNAIGWTAATSTSRAIRSGRVRDVDFYPYGEYELRAFALADDAAGGVTIYMERRHYDASTQNNAHSNTTTRMLRCRFDPDTGTLFYMDAATVYSTSLTNLIAALGGTFADDYSKAIPDSLTLDSQYNFVYASNVIYVIGGASENEIHAILWPSGSFTLRYGAIGSGATHEILPDLAAISSISLAYYRSRPFLVCTGETAGGAFLAFAIDLIKNEMADPQAATTVTSPAATAQEAT